MRPLTGVRQCPQLPSCACAPVPSSENAVKLWLGPCRTRPHSARRLAFSCLSRFTLSSADHVSGPAVVGLAGLPSCLGMVRTEVDIALHFHGRAPFNSDGGCSRPGREQHAGISASRDRRSLVGRHPQANKQRLSTADRLCVPKLPPLCARARAAPCWIGGRLTECRLYEEEGAKHNVLCRPHVPWRERSDFTAGTLPGLHICAGRRSLHALADDRGAGRHRDRRSLRPVAARVPMLCEARRLLAGCQPHPPTPCRNPAVHSPVAGCDGSVEHAGKCALRALSRGMSWMATDPTLLRCAAPGGGTPPLPFDDHQL